MIQLGLRILSNQSLPSRGISLSYGWVFVMSSGDVTMASFTGRCIGFLSLTIMDQKTTYLFTKKEYEKLITSVASLGVKVGRAKKGSAEQAMYSEGVQKIKEKPFVFLNKKRNNCI